MAKPINKLRIHYEGRFEGYGATLKYVSGSVLESEIDPDMVSFPEVLSMCIETGYVNIKRIWYSRPGYPFGKGIREITNDKSALEMMNELIKFKIIDVYIEHYGGISEFGVLAEGVEQSNSTKPDEEPAIVDHNKSVQNDDKPQSEHVDQNISEDDLHLQSPQTVQCESEHSGDDLEGVHDGQESVDDSEDEPDKDYYDFAINDSPAESFGNDTELDIENFSLEARQTEEGGLDEEIYDEAPPAEVDMQDPINEEDGNDNEGDAIDTDFSRSSRPVSYYAEFLS